MSHRSPRSLRIRQDAQKRPDVVWRDKIGEHQARLDIESSPVILSGGSELSQLVAEADSHLVAMRKIVQ